MSYYADFDPYNIIERDRQIRSEVQTLYLEQKMRKNRKVRGPLRTPPASGAGTSWVERGYPTK
jgi:hypothetical protein